MEMSVAHPGPSRSRMSRITALFWRKPSLGLFLLLLAPLMLSLIHISEPTRPY